MRVAPSDQQPPLSEFPQCLKFLFLGANRFRGQPFAERLEIEVAPDHERSTDGNLLADAQNDLGRLGHISASRFVLARCWRMHGKYVGVGTMAVTPRGSRNPTYVTCHADF